MLGNLHVRFGVGAGGQSPGLHHHLGAAWVLITEHRNGYPHRLLAIGHLHEAEEESQAWPGFHAAIREARKAYQQNRQIPDFTHLSKSLQQARQEGVFAKSKP